MPTVADYPDVLADMARPYRYLEIQELPGAATRGHSGFAPVGAMYHHTAGARTGGPFASLRTVTFGRSDLRNSLANTHRSRLHDGRVTLSIVSLNLCWHAGAGTWHGIVGNARFWGLEAENDGIGEVWQPEELIADRVALAAMLACTPHPSSALLAGHREYATPAGRKIDPRNIDLDDARRGAQLLLDAGSTGGATAHTNREEDTMVCIASWAKRVGSGPLKGRWPFYRLGDDNGIPVVLAYNGAKLERVDGNAYSIPFMRLTGLAGRPDGITESPGGTVEVCCIDGGSITVAKKAA